MQIRLSLSLPRDALSVPVARKVAAESMRVLGVDEGCIGDLQVALTEAAANVLDHSDGEDEYEVSVGIDDETCVVEVVDRGRGFDADLLGRGDAAPDAERGRGIQLMRRLVDNVQFESQPEKGTVVHLVKRLQWNEGAPVHRLSEAGQAEAGSL